MKLMGIYGLEEKECGCTVKWYKGGFTWFNAEKCKADHVSRGVYICSVCKKEMTKRDLKDHRWTHAY